MAEQCGFHERALERIAKCEAKCDVNDAQNKAHEGDIGKLFSKYGELKDVLAQNKICLEKIELTMTEGFKAQNSKLESIKTDLSDLGAKYDENNETINKEIKAAKARLDDLEQFNWFRSRMNKWRDNLPAFIIYILFVIIAFLVSLHWVDFGNFRWTGK